MKRTTVSLTDDLARALAREARRRNLSASAITRSALARHLGLAEDKARHVPFAALGRSGHHHTAGEMEDLLAAEWNDDARPR